jgi:hypothetical protein
MRACTSELPRTAADIPIEVYTQPDPALGGAQMKTTSGESGSGSTAAAPGPAPPHPVCVVCRCAMEYHAAVKKLLCAHLCHADCANRWLRDELHCPLCKNQVLFPMAQPTVVYGGGGLAARPPPVVEAFPRPVPVDGARSRDNGVCRDCGQVFYRNPLVVRPETNAYYRCANCRSHDAVSMMRASCALQ